MNEEKKTSQMKSSAGEYLAPKVKVVEIKARRVMCCSPYDSNFSDSNPENLNFG